MQGIIITPNHAGLSMLLGCYIENTYGMKSRIVEREEDFSDWENIQFIITDSLILNEKSNIINECMLNGISLCILYHSDLAAHNFIACDAVHIHIKDNADAMRLGLDALMSSGTFVSDNITTSIEEHIEHVRQSVASMIVDADIPRTELMLLSLCHREKGFIIKNLNIKEQTYYSYIKSHYRRFLTEKGNKKALEEFAKQKGLLYHGRVN